MNDLFRQRYRIASNRLRDWDYRRAAAYFVTICTQNRRPFFGHIRNHHMELSRIGDYILGKAAWAEDDLYCRTPAT